MNLEGKRSNVKWEKFAHALLTTTCLGVVGGASASATSIIVIEGVGSAPTDFSNTMSGASELPFSTSTVQGQLHQTSDNADWFEFTSLTPGSGFSLLGKYNPLRQERGVAFTVFNSSGTQLGLTTLEGQGRTVSGTAPSDGNLIVDIHFAQSGSPTYEMDFTGTYQVPEPGSGVGAGLAAAAAAAVAWRRKRARA
jgi:hypothetical protein